MGAPPPLEEAAMTTTPDGPVSCDDEDVVPDRASTDVEGAEIGMTPGEGTTFEPEEDPDALS
jgi:hypothetical protein